MCQAYSRCRADQVPSTSNNQVLSIQCIFLVVCDGTNNYVNHFWADIRELLENEEIRMNLFQISMWPACSQFGNGEGLSDNTVKQK